MSGILNIVLMLGLVGGGLWFVMNRCTLIPEICQPAAAAAAAAPPVAEDAAAAATDVSNKASDSDNGKKQKCGCCNCKQNSAKEIVCDTGAGSVKFTGGLSLDAQCNACANDSSICKNAKAAQSAAKQAANNQKVTKSGSVRCADGSSLKNGVCVLNSSKSKKTPTPNTVVDGCPKGTFRDCALVGAGVKTINCKCSKSRIQYARAMYGTQARVYYGGVPSHAFVSTQYDTYRPFRNRISFK